MSPKTATHSRQKKNVIKSEQMSGYQKHLMADLNLDPPNNKTLVVTLRVKLRAT